MKKLTNHVKNKLRFISLLILIIASFCYAMFQGGFVSWFLFSSFLPIAFYSICIYFYPLKNIQIVRVNKQFEYYAGEAVSITLKITRANRFPLFYLFIEDEVDQRFRDKCKQPFKFLLFPFLKKEMIYTYTIEKIPRGEYQFNRFRIQIGDFIGVIRKEISYDNEEKFIVYPSYVEMNVEQYVSQYESGMMASNDKIQRDSSIVTSVRKYVPGDKFSWINWKQTARKDEMMTKEFEQSETNDVVVVLDCTEHPQFELSVTFTASIIHALHKKRVRIGLHTFSKKRVYFPPQNGEVQLRTLTHHLAGIESVGVGIVEFSRMIETELSFQNRNQTFMIVTNALSKQTIETLSVVHNRKGQVALFIIKAKNEKLNKAEVVLLESARMRGILAKTMYEGEFAKAVNFNQR